MSSRASNAAASAFVDVAAVVGAWTFALLAENAAIGFLWREQFLGPWEISLARHAAAPLALAGLGPLALLFVGVWRLAVTASEGAWLPKRALGVLGGAASCALALGVSEGRHFASTVLRAPFVGGLSALGVLAGAWLLPRLASPKVAPVVLGLLGLALAAGGWLADGYVLPRLYPAFHTALLVASLSGAALAAMAGRSGSRPPGWITLAVGAAVLALPVVCAVTAPSSARALDRDASLRIVLVEHAPFAGRAVAAAMAMRAPEPEAAPAALAIAPVPGEVARALDWEGHDVLLLTVDALRADHVSAYGYARATTPNIDALAGQGTVFDAAYCPTPHTSYSLTSMMTGKYLRPLLKLGQGQDSETWAQDLRRYGWRTAAFYPPAVFFIDQERFATFEDERLGFEYAKVEFAGPALREEQVKAYLDSAPADRPLFLWVHFFEPHEPYVVHPGHVFSGGPSADVDAYDSEVAEADDGIGRVVRLMRLRHADPVILVTADHGEEFGEHGGRYHGTTVYEEQVRVPLVVVGPGVRPGARSASVAQTIDLLPTTLSALGVPRPARLRGRDLGPVLAGARDAGAADEGFALAETDDYELLARGPDRLICERRAAACALYRPGVDAAERRDFASDAAPRFQALRSQLAATMRDHGRYEVSGDARWPEALRRGLQGDVEAAADVASLLEDADVTIRRKAAEVSFELHAAAAIPEEKRALAGDEDEPVRSFAALALARAGEPVSPAAVALIRSSDATWRRRAALALGDRGDPRACDELASWWSELSAAMQGGGPDGEPPRLTIDLRAARELFDATVAARCRAAVPAIVHVLEDVRARPYAADALGALGDDRARLPLLRLLGTEPYVTSRPHEARALLALGVRDWLAPSPASEVSTTLAGPPGPARIAVLLSDAAAHLEMTANGGPPVSHEPTDGGSQGGVTNAWQAEAPGGDEGEVRVLDFSAPRDGRLRLQARASTGTLLAIWRLGAPRLD